MSRYVPRSMFPPNSPPENSSFSYDLYAVSVSTINEVFASLNINIILLFFRITLAPCPVVTILLAFEMDIEMSGITLMILDFLSVIHQKYW